jgi:hypothetical protein
LSSPSASILAEFEDVLFCGRIGLAMGSIVYREGLGYDVEIGGWKDYRDARSMIA